MSFRFFALLLFVSFNLTAQYDFNLYTGLRKVCAGDSIEIDYSKNGNFNPDNIFTLKIYSSDSKTSSSFITQQTLHLNGNSTYIKTSQEMANKEVFLSVVSSSPYRVFDQGFFPVFGVLNVQRTLSLNELDNLYFDQYQKIDLEFNASGITKWNSPGTVYFNDGTSAFAGGRIIKSIFPDTSGQYGIIKIENFCGVNEVDKYYQVNLKSQRLKLDFEDIEYCQGQKVKVQLQSDQPLPENLQIGAEFRDENNSLTSPVTYSNDNKEFIFEIPTDHSGGIIKVLLNFSSLGFEETLTIKTKQRGIHAITGSYFLDEFNSAIISDYSVSNTPLNFDHTKTKIALNNGALIQPNADGVLKIQGLAPGQHFLKTVYNDCPQGFYGSFTLQTGKWVEIEELPEKICLAQGLDIKIKSGHYYDSGDHFDVSFSDEFYSQPIVLQGSLEGNNIVHIDSAGLATLDLRNRYSVHVDIPNRGILGKESSSKVTILDIPKFTNFRLEDGYPLWNTGTVAMLFSPVNYAEGYVTMSDGKDYELYQINPGLGKAVLMPQHEGIYTVVKTFNQCGTDNLASGSINLSFNNPSSPAVQLGWISRAWGCGGDSLKFEWGSYGSFNPDNKFYAEFTSLNGEQILKSTELKEGDNGTVIPYLDSFQYVYFRLRSTSPASLSTRRVYNIHGTEVPNVFYFSAQVKSGAVQGGSSFGNQIDVSSESIVDINVGDLEYFESVLLDSLYNPIINFENLQFSKDTIIKVKYFENKCGITPFDREIRINHVIPELSLSRASFSCNGSLTTIEVPFQRLINQNEPLGVKAFIINSNGQSVSINFKEINYEKLLFTFDRTNYSPGNYTLKIESVDDFPLLNYSFKILPEEYYLTTETGPQIDTIATDLYLYWGIKGGYPVFYQANIEPSPPYNEDVEVFSYYAHDKCGYVDVLDTVKINIIPHIIRINGVTAPCIGSGDSIIIYFEKTIEDFKPEANLSLFLVKGNSHFPLKDARIVGNRFAALLPEGIPSGNYQVGYSRQNPNHTKIFTDYYYQIIKSQDARIVNGTIYLYPNDTYNYPVFMDGDNETVSFLTSISEEHDFDEFGVPIYSPLIVPGQGYHWVEQFTLFPAEGDIYPTTFMGSYGSCRGNLSGNMQAILLEEGTPKMYTLLADDDNSLIFNCQADDTLSIKLETSGSFNSNNNFIPQISNKEGVNFQDLANEIIDPASKTYRIFLPNNLEAGEGYRVRFRSTSPELYGASSSFGLIVHSKPSFTLTSPNSILDGDSARIDLSFQGKPPFNVSGLSSQNLTMLESYFSSFYLKGNEDITFSIQSLSDKYCSNEINETYNIDVLCRESIEILEKITSNLSQKANYIDLNAGPVSGVNASFTSGKAVLLKPGFEAQSGSIFSALTGGCQ